MIGQGTIRENACIGAEATLLNCSVLSQAVIPPSSLLGDPTWGREQERVVFPQTESREAERVQEAATPPTVSEAPPPSPEAAGGDKATPREEEAAAPGQEELGGASSTGYQAGQSWIGCWARSTLTAKSSPRGTEGCESYTGIKK